LERTTEHTEAIMNVIERVPSTIAMDEMSRLQAMMQAPMMARRLWEWHFSRADKSRLAISLSAARHRFTPLDMWKRVHGASDARTVLDMALAVGAIGASQHQTMLREFGETLDADEAKLDAIAAGQFVILDLPREAYWAGEMINVDFHDTGESWEFLWQLARAGKVGAPIDRVTFGDFAHEKIVAQRKNRFRKRGGPASLLAKIRPKGTGAQQLMLPAEEIRIFESPDGGAITEWFPASMRQG